MRRGVNKHDGIAALMGSSGGGVRRSMVMALGGSFVLHLVVLGAIVGFSWEPRIEPEREPLERVFISFDRPAPAPAPSDVPPAISESVRGVDDAGRADAVLDVLESITSFETDASRTDEPVDLVAELLGESGGGGLGDEPVRLDGALESLGGGMPDVGFAGLGASNARSVVYVVDASGPMVGTLPIVIDELERSVLALDPAQEFQVVFVNGDGEGGYLIAPGSGGLIRALPGEVRRVVRWCRTVRAHGRSDPVPALERALAMRPDAVFLFSRVSTYIGAYEQDREGRLAEVRSRVLARLDEVNPRSAETGLRRTAIRVVQFHEQDPSGLFRAIAREHGGGIGEIDAYRFITREDGSFR